MHYFIGYPEDYTQSSMEWEKQTLTNRSHRPAFETIFAFNQQEGTLEIYCTRSNKIVIQDLQGIFASAILGVELENHQHLKNRFEYDLSPLLNRRFLFNYDPIKSGIKYVDIERISLFIPSTGRKIMLWGNIKRDKKDIYNFLDTTGEVIPLDEVIVQQVGFKVGIVDPHMPNIIKKVTFHVTHPNSCTLKHTDLNKKIRQMLIDSGIEPKPILQSLPIENAEAEPENKTQTA